MKRLYLSLIIFALLSGIAFAEVIKLKNGETVKGKILERTEDTIKVDPGIGVSVSYYLDEIESIDGVEVMPPIVKEKESLVQSDLGGANDEVPFKNIEGVEEKVDMLASSGEVVLRVEGIPGSDMETYQIFSIGNTEIARKRIAYGMQGGKFESKVVSMTGRIPDGIVKVYDSDGALRGEMPYKDNREHGLARNYYRSGSLMREANYVNGKQEGTVKIFYESGALRNETTTGNDGSMMNIRNKGYYEDGSVKFEMDPLKGVFNLYDESGNLLPQGKVMDEAFMIDFLGMEELEGGFMFK